MILGLYSPRPQSGKSTIAEHFRQTHGGTLRVSYATPLKRCLQSLVNALGVETLPHWDVFTKGDRSSEVLPGITARDLLVGLGMYLRQRYPGIFLLPMTRNIESAKHNGYHLVIDDVRFPDELAQVRAAGGMVWAIFKPSLEDTPASESDGLLGHSLMALHGEFGWERTIINDQDMKHLISEADILYAMERV